MDAVLKQKIDLYAANAFSSARQKIVEESEQQMAALPQMGKGNAAYSKYADSRYIKLYAQRINDLTVAKGNALMDAYEICEVPLDDRQILIEVGLFRDQSVAGMASGIKGGLSLEAMRTRGDTQRSSMIGERFHREITLQTHHIVGEVSCQLEQRKIMPKFKKAESSAPTIVFQDNARLNLNSTDNSVNTVINQSNVFSEIRNRISTGIAAEEQATILERLTALEQAQTDPPSFKERYREFMAIAADHLTLLPYLPALAEVLHRIVG